MSFWKKNGKRLWFLSCRLTPDLCSSTLDFCAYISKTGTPGGLTSRSTSQNFCCQCPCPRSEPQPLSSLAGTQSCSLKNDLKGGTYTQPSMLSETWRKGNRTNI